METKTLASSFALLALLGTARFAAVAADESAKDREKVLQKLKSKDVEDFLAARKTVLLQSELYSALLEPEIGKLSVKQDQILSMRLQSVVKDIETIENTAALYRLTEEALRRADTLRTDKEFRGKNIVALVSQEQTRKSLTGEFWGRHPYARTCYFSFPKNTHGYDGAVSLQYGNPTDHFNVRMYGGQESRINNLGPVKYEDVQDVRNVFATKPARRRDITLAKAVLGNTYIVHCLEDGGKLDMTVKFRVLELEPNEWVIIEWEAIPQAK